jgi:hypothetical protein
MARGDRLEVEHRIVGSTVTYLHHGIDVGDGTVVHARPHDFRNPFGGGRVERTSRAEFARSAPVRLRTDPPAAYTPDDIVARALAHVGREGYDIVIDNCEHFTTWCATGRRASRQVDIVLGRVARAVSRAGAVLSAGAAERIAVRTALGTSVRVGLKTLVPAAIVGEAAALAAEWRAHQSGASAAESRRAGEAAGLAASAVTFAVAGAAGGPAGVLAGACAGAAMWVGGSVAGAAATGASRQVAKRIARGTSASP